MRTLASRRASARSPERPREVSLFGGWPSQRVGEGEVLKGSPDGQGAIVALEVAVGLSYSAEIGVL